MVVGEREAEILRELEEGSYQLLVEGILLSFDASSFENRLRSKLYKKMPCPLLLVKNLVGLSKIALLLEDYTDPRILFSTFFELAGSSTLHFDMFRVIHQKPGRLSFKKKAPESSNSALGRTDEFLAKANNVLEETGRHPLTVKTVRDTPAGIAETLQDYGLVVTGIPRQMAKNSPMLEVLSRVPSAVLLCWQ